MLQRSLVMVAILLGAGCVSVRDYPRCYLTRAPSQAELAHVDAETVHALKSTFRGIEVASTRDAVMIKTHYFAHANVAKVWPHLGCVRVRRDPPLTAVIEDKWEFNDCQDYMAKLLTEIRTQQAGGTTSRARTAADHKWTCH